MTRAGGLTAEIVRPSQLGSAEQALWARWRRADPALSSPFFAFDYVRAVGQAHPGVRIAVLARGGTVQAFLPFQHPSQSPVQSDSPSLPAA